MPLSRSAIYLIFLAVAGPYLYDRFVALSSMFANRPGKIQSVNEFKSYETKFSDQIRNCEDVILEEELGIAILSCDPGRDLWNTVMGSFLPPRTSNDDEGGIWIYDYSTPDLPDSSALRPLKLEKPMSLHPLGIDYDADTSTLYVINHSRTSGSVIEIFSVSLKEATAKHKQTFSHPLLHAPNAVHLLGNGKMYVSNDHYVRAAVSPMLSQIETFSGVPGGTVVYIDTNAPQEAAIVARVSFANGIAMLNATTLAVASSSKAGVYFFQIAEDGKTLRYQTYVRTPASADNLSVDRNGKLLIAGHPFAPELVQVSQGRAACVMDGTEEQRRACGCWAPSWAGEWSEKDGLKTLFRDSGKTEGGVCSSATVVRDVKRGVGMISMLYGKGVVVFKE